MFVVQSVTTTNHYIAMGWMSALHPGNANPVAKNKSLTCCIKQVEWMINGFWHFAPLRLVQASVSCNNDAAVIWAINEYISEVRGLLLQNSIKTLFGKHNCLQQKVNLGFWMNCNSHFWLKMQFWEKFLQVVHLKLIRTNYYSISIYRPEQMAL